MKIVVCDDNVEDLTEIERLLTGYREHSPGVMFETELFQDPAELYHRISGKKPDEIYILDMIMDEKTGIDIGSLIRSMDARSVIIYITSSDDFALEAYGVRAVRYLLKPVQADLFFEAMDYAVSCTRMPKDDIYTIKTKEGLVAVPYGKIEYIENYSRTLNICLTDGSSIKSIFIRRSFDEEIGLIASDARFVQVHKSFLVNMDHVDKLAQGAVIMESGRDIPVSKTRAADVKRDYLMFMSGRCR